MKRNLTLLIILVLTVHALYAQKVNLVKNGTFEMDRTGFKTDYNLQDGFSKEGEYVVTNNVTTDLYSKGFKNPIPSTGKFLFINGFHYPRTTKRCWYDSVSVQPNTTYIFSYSVASVIALNPPQLEFNVNGKSASEIFYISESNYWQTRSTTYTTKSDQTRIEISIVDVNKVSTYGNDFAIDNIVFGPEKETPPVKEKEPVIKETSLETSLAQCSSTPTIFLQDFGTNGDGEDCYSTTAADNMTGVAFWHKTTLWGNNVEPNDGQYSLICNLSEFSDFWLWHDAFADHTSGDVNGNLVLINDGLNSDFYKKTLTGLSANSNYIVTFYLANAADSDVGGCGLNYLPEITGSAFTVGTTTGTTTNLGTLAPTSSPVWFTYTFNFRTGPTQTGVDIVLRNITGIGCGNDFLFDDFFVQLCVPPQTIATSPGTGVDNEASVIQPKAKPLVIIPPKLKPLVAILPKPSIVIQPKPKPPVLIPPKTKLVPPRSVKKDATSQMVAVSADFKKDLSIDEIKVDQKLQLSHIYFEQGKFNLLATSMPELNDLVTFMKKYPSVRIKLEGHTDNQGNPERNVELSENRSKEVRKYLMDQGIDENRIEWIGYGGQRPAYSNADKNLRPKNRRVEVVIIGK